MEYVDIIYKKEGGIATMTLNRPESMNAFTPEMSKSMLAAAKDAESDPNVRVFVLTGAGRAFCTGMDVKRMAEKASQASRTGEAALFPQHRSLPVTLHQMEKPVICAINGTAAGGGLDLALACDFRIASDRARFSEVFIRRGLIPGLGGTYFLPRLIGMDKALQMVMTGDLVEAKEAERIGLVTMVVPHEDLESATRDFAAKLIKAAPLAIKEAKKAIYQGMRAAGLEEQINYAQDVNTRLRLTEDHKEGARAFVEKREPVFKGR